MKTIKYQLLHLLSDNFCRKNCRRPLVKGGRYLEPKIWTQFVAVITFSPFFCANNYYTSLLLIVCALRWYINSLYRHLFLVDISKNARVTHFLICGKDNSKAPWATRPQIGLSVAKGRSCDTDESKKFVLVNPHLSYGAEKRRDHFFFPTRQYHSYVL